MPPCHPLQVLFHQPFLERCKQLIQAGLEAAASCINEPLAAALAAAAQHEPEAAGRLRPGSWPLTLLSAPSLGEAGLDRTYSFPLAGRTGSGAWNVAASQSLGLMGSGSLVTALSGQLAAAAADNSAGEAGASLAAQQRSPQCQRLSRLDSRQHRSTSSDSP